MARRPDLRAVPRLHEPSLANTLLTSRRRVLSRRARASRRVSLARLRDAAPRLGPLPFFDPLCGHTGSRHTRRERLVNAGVLTIGALFFQLHSTTEMVVNLTLTGSWNYLFPRVAAYITCYLFLQITCYFDSPYYQPPYLEGGLVWT
jgi:hypothetical protein